MKLFKLEEFLTRWGTSGASVLIERAADWIADDRKALAEELKGIAFELEEMLKEIPTFRVGDKVLLVTAERIKEFGEEVK